jgi:hypothetical protein
MALFIWGIDGKIILKCIPKNGDGRTDRIRTVQDGNH